MFFLVDVKKKDIQILKFYSRLGLNSSKPSTKPSATSLIHFFQDTNVPVQSSGVRKGDLLI